MGSTFAYRCAAPHRLCWCRRSHVAPCRRVCTCSCRSCCCSRGCCCRASRRGQAAATRPRGCSSRRLSCGLPVADLTAVATAVAHAAAADAAARRAAARSAAACRCAAAPPHSCPAACFLSSVSACTCTCMCVHGMCRCAICDVTSVPTPLSPCAWFCLHTGMFAFSHAVGIPIDPKKKRFEARSAHKSEAERRAQPSAACRRLRRAQRGAYKV